MRKLKWKLDKRDLLLVTMGYSLACLVLCFVLPSEFREILGVLAVGAGAGMFFSRPVKESSVIEVDGKTLQEMQGAASTQPTPALKELMATDPPEMLTQEQLLARRRKAKGVTEPPPLPDPPKKQTPAWVASARRRNRRIQTPPDDRAFGEKPKPDSRNTD